MKPYYDKDGITIYHGDCRDVMPALADESIDLVATDPPYGINYVTGWREKGHKLVKPIANDESVDIVSCVAPELNRVLRNDRHWYLFASPRVLGGQ